MCCLRYEFEAYRDFKSRAPKRNAVIDTPLGKAKIVEYDTPKEQLCLRLESGKQIRVALADMTASEAAHKKSEELGCPCRPDTVAREVLDKLESPDVQMALAELDRKNGVLAEPEVDASDIFVEPKRKRRRPSNGAPTGEKSAGTGAPAASSDEGAPAASRRRRKRRPGDGGAPVAEPASTQPTSRRRRHHQAAEGEAASTQAGQQPAKRTRRPGDKGGQAAQPKGGGMQPSRKRRAPQAGGSQEQGGQQPGTGTEGATKRRRRRRGGRGRGGSAEGGAPTGE